jgi:hypothetical protein
MAPTSWGIIMSKGRFYSRLDARRAMLMAAPFCAIFAAQKAHAIDHNPTDLATLRTALIAVNAAATNDRIFLPAGTITLNAGRLDDANASGDLDITKASGTLEIIGAGQTTTILDAGTFDRVLHIDAAADVTISNLTIRNGLATDSPFTATNPLPAAGGGILKINTGDLTLTNVTITQCEVAGPDAAVAGGPGSSGSGGGLYATGGAVTITDCTLSNNTARGGDGAAGSDGMPTTGSGSVFGTTGGFGGTGGDAFGGGMICAGSSLIVTRTTISGNVAVAGSGGAGGSGGDAFATGNGTTVLAVGGDGGGGGNGGSAIGGGVWCGSLGGTLELRSCCVSGNGVSGGHSGIGGTGGDGTAAGAATFSTAVGGNGGAGGSGGFNQGGGVVAGLGTVTIVNSTISGNGATGGNGANGGAGGAGSGGTFSTPGSGGNGGDGRRGEGGGIYTGAGTLDIANSTIASNTASGGSAGGGGPPGAGGTSSSSGADGFIGSGHGGGLYIQGAATVSLDSSIVADNTAIDPNTGSPSSHVDGTMTADACVIENTNGASITAGPNGNLNGDPGLSALALNGGPTRNHRIAETSIARDAGTNPLTLTTDQRGQPRDDGGGVDVGAFEFINGVDDIGGGGGTGGGGDDGGGGGCSTGTKTGRMWLIAPVLAVVALFRRRRNPAKFRQRS